MSGEQHLSVVVFGGGGHAKVVVSTLLQSGQPVEAVYDDDEVKWGQRLLGVPIGPRASGSSFAGSAVVAIGDNAIRERIAAGEPSRRWAAPIHPTAYVDPSARIGPGTVVLAGAVVQPDAVIGAHAIINTGATIDHDCVIGDFAHVGPGVHLAGSVKVGRGALLGIGSSVLPGICIGQWSTVGAGSVVTRNLPERTVAIGIPAKIQGPRGRTSSSE